MLCSYYGKLHLLVRICEQNVHCAGLVIFCIFETIMASESLRSIQGIKNKLVLGCRKIMCSCPYLCFSFLIHILFKLLTIRVRVRLTTLIRPRKLWVAQVKHNFQNLWSSHQRNVDFQCSKWFLAKLSAHTK